MEQLRSFAIGDKRHLLLVVFDVPRRFYILTLVGGELLELAKFDDLDQAERRFSNINREDKIVIYSQL